MGTKWATLAGGIYNTEHHPSLHENTKNVNAKIRKRAVRGGVFTEFPGRQRWNIKRDERREERRYAEYFNYTGRAEVINHGFV